MTVAVKMGPIIDTGHQMKQFETFHNKSAFLTFGYDGNVILRKPHVPVEYGELYHTFLITKYRPSFSLFLLCSIAIYEVWIQ